MSNDTPPRACLADYGFMTIVLSPSQPLACGAQLGGDTMTFMSPELLVPPMFGFEDSIPTPEADIYAFGLVIFQVCERDGRYRPFTYIAQVLTGEIPFRGIRAAELVYDVVQGVRPAKPENASTIGFSDTLWDFVQRCWDGNTKLRPKVVEVVIRLGRAAADYGVTVPPSVEPEKPVPVPVGQMADLAEYCKFEILILS